MQKVFYRVARVGAIPRGEGRILPLGEGACALFCTADGQYYATGSLCPHQNTPLDRAHLEGCEVTCLRHHYRFDLRTGDCLTIGGYGLPVYEVRIEGEDIFVGRWED